jgi:hypothetical protein
LLENNGSVAKKEFCLCYLLQSLFLYKGVSFFESLLNSFLLFFWYLTLLSSAGFLVPDKTFYHHLQGADLTERAKISMMLAYQLVMKSE